MIFGVVEIVGPDADPKSILIIRPSALGDVCRTVPALVSLRKAYPDARIDWLVRDTFVEAIEAHPDLDEVIGFPRRDFADWWRSPATARTVKRWIRDLRDREYDVAIDLQGLGRSGLMARWSRARRRVGFANAREFGWMGYTIRHDPPRTTHIVDQMLELLEREGVTPVRDLRLYTPKDAAEWWASERTRRGIGPSYAVLAPTSRHESKRWPIENWCHLPPVLRDRGVEQSVLIGAPDEYDQVEPLAEQMKEDDNVIDLVGETTIARTMAVIQNAAIVIANDSAPLHMAVGFDRKLVALFGPTDPSFVGPYRRDDCLVRPANIDELGEVNYRNLSGDELMRGISVAVVTNAISRQLASNPVRR